MSIPETNGHHLQSKTISELEWKLARHRTAIVALVAYIRRVGGYLSQEDQHLLRQAESVLDDEAVVFVVTVPASDPATP